LCSAAWGIVYFAAQHEIVKAVVVELPRLLKWAYIKSLRLREVEEADTSSQ
jgi:hypothetical protein